MVPAHYFLMIAAAVAGLAAWYDWRTGHIPNWLTLGALAIAPIAHFGLAAAFGAFDLGVQEAGFSVAGALVCGIVPIMLYRMGGIYGGDVKLLAAVGAILGTLLGVEAQLYSFVIGMAYAFGKLAHQGRLLGTLGNSFALVANPLRSKEKRREIAPEMMSEMRFGPSIFVGVVATMIIQWGALR